MNRQVLMAGRRLRRAAGSVRAIPLAQLGLRGALAVSGGLALLVAPAGQLVGAGLVALVAVPPLLSAVRRPDGAGPALVMAGAGAAWALRYSTGSAPLATALVLAALLYLHHTTAALCAAMPATAAVDPTVLLRWATQAVVVLAVTAAAASLLAALGHPPASATLEVAGLVAVIALAGALVALARAAADSGPAE
jgi:hypothetical protein